MKLRMVFETTKNAFLAMLHYNRKRRHMSDTTDATKPCIPYSRDTLDEGEMKKYNIMHECQYEMKFTKCDDHDDFTILQCCDIYQETIDMVSQSFTT